MIKKKPLASAISAVTASMAIGAALPAMAEEGAEAIEEVIVTGSRIPTAVSDAPRPVTVLDRQEIELSGLGNVADVLRTTTYNSFGSFRDRSGTSFGQIALVGLRGLGEDRTAVLINGRRVPGNPLTGTSAVDLNTIPLSAVERIEMLTDSASAIYGADAIGGVINVIMRDDWTGAEIEIGGERPTRKGGDRDQLSFTIGMAGDRGHVLFSGEWWKRKPIFDADRDYSRVDIAQNPNGGLPRHGVDTIGVSSGGNTMFELDFSSAFPGGACPEPLYVPISDPEGITGTEGCGFGYADISMQTGGIDRKSTFLTASYELVPGHNVYFENRFTDSKTFGRYAPAVGFFLVDDEAPLNPTLGTPGQRDLFLFHRFVGHGNRDDSVATKEVDNILGFKGAIFDDRVNYDVYARHYSYDAQEEGDTYVISSIIEDLVADGSYNFVNPLDPTNAGAIQQSAATLLRDIRAEETSVGLTVDGMAFELPAGAIGWAAGLERASTEYQDQYDNFREAGNVIGSAGNSAAGDRSRWAAFGEIQIPILDNMEGGVAVRYDDYDDFGDEFSPQVYLRFQPIDQLVLRASWSEGFKAPNLADVHQELSQSFENVRDFTRCRQQGIADTACPQLQVESFTGGNPNLEAETSESWNFGAVIDVMDSLTFSIDYFDIEIKGAVNSLLEQEVVDLEADNPSALPSGIIINRGATVNGVVGPITRCEGGGRPPACGLINVFGNFASIETQGLDMRVHYDLPIDQWGTWALDAEWSHVLKYEETTLPGADPLKLEGEEEHPDNRLNVSLRWQIADFTVNYIMRWIDETGGATATSKYPSFTTHDVTAVWHMPWGGDLTMGVRNLTDEDPSFDNEVGYDDDIVLELYDVAGRVPFLTYKHSF